MKLKKLEFYVKSKHKIDHLKKLSTFVFFDKENQLYLLSESFYMILENYYFNPYLRDPKFNYILLTSKENKKESSFLIEDIQYISKDKIKKDIMKLNLKVDKYNTCYNNLKLTKKKRKYYKKRRDVIVFELLKLQKINDIL